MDSYTASFKCQQLFFAYLFLFLLLLSNDIAGTAMKYANIH